MVRNTEDLKDLIERTRDPVAGAAARTEPLVRLRQSQHREPQRDARGDRARGEIAGWRLGRTSLTRRNVDSCINELKRVGKAWPP
jgi:hypothetical protein